MSGPPPTPTAILKARGSWRAKLRPDEPLFRPSAPQLPDWLPANAVAEWDKLVPKLLALGVLAEVDVGMLAAYCLTAALVVDLTQQIGAAKSVAKIAKLQRRRQETIAEQIKLAQQFGLSPSARTRVKGTKPHDADPLEAFLQKKAT